MVDDFNKNCKLAEKEDFIRSEQVSWTNNPLFFSDNTQRDSELHSFMPANERLKKAGQHETGLKNTEFETESGYSETVSVLSELSSPSQSVSSYVSFSEEENDLIDEITENMRQASVVRTPCKDVDGNAGVTNAAQIVSSKGTVRGVKNRVRDNILHFLSGSQSDSKKYAKKNDANTEIDPDRGKVIIYTTSLGLVRATQYECKYVKRVFYNLMVRFDERDLFVHPHFKSELQIKLGKDVITLPQIFIDGKLVGGAKDVERMIETGTMKDALESVDRVSHAQSCSTCGGYKFINCSKCSGSGKSRRTRFSREINSLKCSACTNGILSCPECNS